MNEKVKLFLENLRNVHLFFGKGAIQTGERVAAKLAIKGMAFSVKEYEEAVKTIKTNTKWYQKIRMNQKLQHLYYAQFAGQLHKIEQALVYQKNIMVGGEEAYRAAMYIRETGQISKMKDINNILKKKPGMKWFPISQALRAVLAGRPESADELATAYEDYYNRLTDLNWYSGKQGKLAALLLVLGTGTFDASVWERVCILSKVMEDEDRLELDTYNVICLLALARVEAEALPEIYAIHDILDERSEDLPLGDDLLLIAAQLYTSSEAYSDIPEMDASEVDFLDLAGSVIDGAFDGSSGGGDGGSDGGGDGGGGGGD